MPYRSALLGCGPRGSRLARVHADVAGREPGPTDWDTDDAQGPRALVPTCCRGLDGAAPRPCRPPDGRRRHVRIAISRGSVTA